MEDKTDQQIIEEALEKAMEQWQRKGSEVKMSNEEKKKVKEEWEKMSDEEMEQLKEQWDHINRRYRNVLRRQLEEELRLLRQTENL